MVLHRARLTSIAIEPLICASTGEHLDLLLLSDWLPLLWVGIARHVSLYFTDLLYIVLAPVSLGLTDPRQVFPCSAPLTAFTQGRLRGPTSDRILLSPRTVAKTDPLVLPFPKKALPAHSYYSSV